MTARRDVSAGGLHDVRGAIIMLRLPRTRGQDPLAATVPRPSVADVQLIGVLLEPCFDIQDVVRARCTSRLPRSQRRQLFELVAAGDIEPIVPPGDTVVGRA